MEDIFFPFVHCVVGSSRKWGVVRGVQIFDGGDRACRAQDLSNADDFVRNYLLFFSDFGPFNCVVVGRFRETAVRRINIETSLQFARRRGLIQGIIFFEHVPFFHQHLNFNFLLPLYPPFLFELLSQLLVRLYQFPYCANALDYLVRVFVHRFFLGL